MITINIDIVFQYLYFITRQYQPSVPNKKKIKQVIECMPYFLPTHKDQQLFFELFQQNSIANYDTNDAMVIYGYIIYEEYHKRKQLPYLDRHHYILHYDHIMFPTKEPSYLIFCIVIICLAFIYVY